MDHSKRNKQRINNKIVIKALGIPTVTADNISRVQSVLITNKKDKNMSKNDLVLKLAKQNAKDIISDLEYIIAFLDEATEEDFNNDSQLGQAINDLVSDVVKFDYLKEGIEGVDTFIEWETRY